MTSLDSFLYLETNYGLTATLLALQRKNQLDSGFVFIQLWCSALVTVLSYGLCIYVATDLLRTCNTSDISHVHKVDGYIYTVHEQRL